MRASPLTGQILLKNAKSEHIKWTECSWRLSEWRMCDSQRWHELDPALGSHVFAVEAISVAGINDDIRLETLLRLMTDDDRGVRRSFLLFLHTLIQSVTRGIRVGRPVVCPRGLDRRDRSHTLRTTAPIIGP